MDFDKDVIRGFALDAGFKLKSQPDDTEDLNPYVYVFAERLLLDYHREIKRKSEAKKAVPDLTSILTQEGQEIKLNQIWRLRSRGALPIVDARVVELFNFDRPSVVLVTQDGTHTTPYVENIEFLELLANDVMKDA